MIKKNSAVHSWLKLDVLIQAQTDVYLQQIKLEIWKKIVHVIIDSTSDISERKGAPHIKKEIAKDPMITEISLHGVSRIVQICFVSIYERR